MPDQVLIHFYYIEEKWSEYSSFCVCVHHSPFVFYGRNKEKALQIVGTLFGLAIVTMT